MQQARTYASGRFKREARYQFEKDLNEGIGTGSAHTGRLTAVYENEEKTS
jgi:hypothetical protein